MTQEVEDWPNSGSGVERLTRFSDAIFAFAMTLLAVDIRVPEIAESLISSQLPIELANLAPKLIGFGLSFFISASYWIFYHRIFGYIKRFDRTLVWLNFLFLLFIVLIPFPSDLIGRYIHQEVSIIIYAVMMTATGLALTLIWFYASYHHRLIDEGLSDFLIRRQMLRTLIAPIVFLVSMPASLLLGVFTPVMWVLVWPLGALVLRFYKE
jgi:uncharacterized membrane protein